MQGVEGVEELLLGALFVHQELDVVHQQDIHVAIFVAEASHLAVAQRVDHVVGEALAGYIADGLFRLALLDLVPDRLHQVGLAHADAAVEEERIVSLGGMLADGAGRGVGKLIAGAGDEIVESVLRIELRGAIPIEPLLLGGTSHGSLQGCGSRVVCSVSRNDFGLLLRFLFGDELDVQILQAEVFHRLAD